MNAKPPLDTLDYEAIEAAVMETPRGRWFLSEYLRRHQAKETERLLAAIARLERAMEREAAVSPRVRAVLMGMAASLCRHVSNAPPALPVAVEAMATEARSIAEALSIIARSDKAAETASNNEDNGEGQEKDAPALADLACRQWELATQMETLAQGIAELAALVDADSPVPGPEPAIPVDALQWFAAHDDLFETVKDDLSASSPRPTEADAAVPASSALSKAPDQGHGAATSGAMPAEESPKGAGGGDAREGHLTVLIRPCRPNEAAERKPADGRGRKPSASGKKKTDSSAATTRQARIIIRHKSSSEEVAIPFLEGTDDKTA